MANPQKRRGDSAEREVAALLYDELGIDCRRALGAGRQDDIGDIHGLPGTVVQVANYTDLARAVRDKLPTVERQMENAGADHGALFVRRRGGAYIVVLTVEQWTTLWKAAA